MYDSFDVRFDQAKCTFDGQNKITIPVGNVVDGGGWMLLNVIKGLGKKLPWRNIAYVYAKGAITDHSLVINFEPQFTDIKSTILH